MRSLTTPTIAVFIIATMLAGCSASSQTPGSSPVPAADGEKTAQPATPTAGESPSAEELSIPFDPVPGAPRVVNARWSDSLAAAEGFTDQPPMLGATPTRLNEANQCVTDLIQVAPELSPGDDARGASDDGLYWISEQLSPGQGGSLDNFIGDSWVPRSGGGHVDIRIAVVAWEDGTNAVIGTRAFPELDVAMLFVITCPVTASSRDEVQARAADGHLDLDVGTRTD